MGPNNEMILECATVSPRLRYLVNYLENILHCTIQVAIQDSGVNIPDNKGTPVIHYGVTPVDRAFNIFSSGLMQETVIRNHEPEIIPKNGQVLLYPAPQGFDLPFDVFSAIFYLLSRYEEYLPFVPDRHGRFEAKQSLAYQNGFLEEPVVDQWMDLLRVSLCQKFPGYKFPESEFRFVSTFDVDSPWAYLYKGFWRTSAGLLKKALELNIHELKYRLKVLFGNLPDPYDTYEYIEQVGENHGFRSLFFFLSGNHSPYDVNYALGSPRFRSLLERLKSLHTIGIHPSYRSNRSFRYLQQEFEHFTQALGQKPTVSRQHFLLLTMPDTYRHLFDLGILEDYSMGYASFPGFRAGTSLPFRFYDLKNECETSLLIHPFQIMDVTLQQYLGLTPGEAAARVENLISRIKAVKGTFTSLWHNESLSETGVWIGWREVFEKMIESGTKDTLLR
jgi:hypothetical protein